MGYYFHVFLLQIEETGRGTVNTCTQVTATSLGKETAIIPMTRIATRITTVTDVHMETHTAAQVVTVTTAPLEKGRMTSTAMTGTTGVIEPITTGELLKLCWVFFFSSLHLKFRRTLLSYHCF